MGKDPHKAGQPKVPEMGGVAPLAVLATVLLTELVGILDDLLDLRQGVKAFLPVIAALPLVAVRAGHTTLTVPFVGPVNFGIFYPLFLVPLGGTGAANAVNMLAGFHGAERGMEGYGHGWARLGGLPERSLTLMLMALEGVFAALAASERRKGGTMELKVVKIEKPAEVNLILGQAHFIKTVEDLHEAMVNAVPGAKFGLAFCEASGPALVRWSGTDPELVELARHNALNLGCGHIFLILMRGMYPINVLNAIKMVPEVCRIFCATANPVEVIVAETEQGRGVLGVIDGVRTKGVEGEREQAERKEFLRKIGYKLG